MNQLKYIKKTSFNPSERTIFLLIPKNWAVGTPQGDQAMRKKAYSLIQNVSKEKSKINQLKYFDKFFKSYYKSCKTNKSFIGADETLPKETVLWFAKELAKCINLQTESLQPLWEDRYNF